MHDDLVKAIYETHCSKIELAWISDKNEGPMDDMFVYGYAMSKRMYPYFHADSNEKDPFENCYRVSKQAMAAVIDYIDGVWSEASNSLPDELMFSNIEKKFNSYSRDDLINIFKYICLSGKFDDSLFDKLVSGVLPPNAYEKFQEEYKQAS